MTEKPSFKRAEWIARQLLDVKVTPDDVYDILLGNITQPVSLVLEVQYYSHQYDEDIRRNNAR